MDNLIINHLAKKAVIKVEYPTVNSDGKVLFYNTEEGISISKFAELIVQECIQHINEENVRLCEYQNSLEPWETSMQYECDLVIQKCIDLVEGLKEHFGVEE